MSWRALARDPLHVKGLLASARHDIQRTFIEAITLIISRICMLNKK